MTQSMQAAQPLPPSHDARLFAVEKDVAGLKESIASLGATVSEGFRSISADMKARGATNWAPVQIGLTLVTIAGGIFFTWVNSNTSRLETSITKVEATVQRYVPREDLDMRFAVVSQRRDDLQRLTDERIARTERDVDAIQRTVVPRGEHEQTWAGQRQRDEGLQRQLDGLRKDLGDLNTPRDTIQGLQRRLDELERERRRAPG